MSRRCKPGIRARIISSSNAGKIVVVVRRYFGEDVNGARWPRAIFPWVVTSLGSPLRSVYIDSGKEAPPSMTIVVDDCDLEPLRDEDEDDGTKAQTSHPKPREATLLQRCPGFQPSR